MSASLFLFACADPSSSPQEAPGRPFNAGATSGEFTKHVFRATNGQQLPYRLLVPADYDPQRAYPLVIWLHGQGESGTDNAKQLVNGVESFNTPENRGRYPAFVLVPQCPVGDRWSNMGSRYRPGQNRMSAQPTRTAQATLELITESLSRYNIDRSRVILVGLSLGGFGTWDWLVRRPDLFTRGLPMSAGGDVTRAPELVGRPIWAIHGTLDRVVVPQHDRMMIDAIEAAGGQPRYEEIPHDGHGPWRPIMEREDVMSWLFE